MKPINTIILKTAVVIIVLILSSHVTETKEIPFNIVPQGADAGNITNLVVSDDMRYFAYISDITNVKLWSFDGKLIKTIIVPKVGMASLAFSPNGSKLLILTRVKLYLLSTNGYIINSIGPEKDEFFPNFYGIPGFHPTGKFFAVGMYTSINSQNTHCVGIYDLEGKLLKTIKGFSNMINRCLYSPDGKFLAVLSLDKKINLYDTGAKLLHSIDGYTGWEHTMFFARDGKFIVTVGNAGTKITRTNGIVVKTLQTQYRSSISHDLNFIVQNSWSEQRIDLLIQDLDKRPVSRLEGVGDVSSIIVTPDNKYILAALTNGLVLIWNKKNGEVARLASRGKDWLIFTPDGYFDSSRNGSNIVSMVKDMEAYGIDQFALRFNRPGLILERLNLGSTSQISYYKYLYQKRLKKKGLSEENILKDLHIPEVKILDTVTNGKIATLTFELLDKKFNLKSYQIFVNDVPLYKESGKVLSGKQQKIKENIALAKGQNKIEISCLNIKGAESYRPVTYATYTGEVTQDLYFLGFGTSVYKDKKLNLKYAHKDAKDLEQLFKTYKPYYNKVHTRIFLDEEVTIANIKKAKAFLNNATIDDTFILFIAGHGVHDIGIGANYYYLTHETDINSLGKTAASFELIETLLEDIKPRKKLFLMDTCESGELEDETANFYMASAGIQGIQSRSFRGLKIVNEDGKTIKGTTNGKIKKKTRTYLLNKDRYIYNDIFRRSGTIIFSSSRGEEFSYEKDEFQNGLFTEAIIKALKDTKSDKNNDKKISIDELRLKVAETVAQESNNLQNPTIDRDNIYQGFSFPVP